MRGATHLLVAFGLAIGATGCDVDQTREGELPEVEMREGQLPEYDVDTAEVDVTTRPDTVNVPDVDVDVDSRSETVRVPDVDVTMPDDDQD